MTKILKLSLLVIFILFNSCSKSSEATGPISFCSNPQNEGIAPTEENLLGTWAPLQAEFVKYAQPYPAHCDGANCCPQAVPSYKGDDLTFFKTGSTIYTIEPNCAADKSQKTIVFQVANISWGDSGACSGNFESPRSRWCEVPSYDKTRLICHFLEYVGGTPSATKLVIEYQKR